MDKTVGQGHPETAEVSSAFHAEKLTNQQSPKVDAHSDGEHPEAKKDALALF